MCKTPYWFTLTDTGGMLLYVPPGVWLTGPFNLTSHMTLFLARGAVIKATQVSFFFFFFGFVLVRACG